MATGCGTGTGQWRVNSSMARCSDSSAERATAGSLRAAGFDVVSWAGNHCMDWGPDGFFDTLDALRGEDIKAAPAHVLGHALGPQRVIEVVRGRPGLGLQHCMGPSGQLEAPCTCIDASGQATERSGLRLDDTGHVAQDVGR